MTFISTPEKIGFLRGREEGRLSAKKSILIRQLEHKFGITEKERISILATEDSAVLVKALYEFVDATSKDQVLVILGQPRQG